MQCCVIWGSLTQLGVLTVDNLQNLDRVEAVLNNQKHLRRGRIHPIDVLKGVKNL